MDVKLIYKQVFWWNVDWLPMDLIIGMNDFIYLHRVP